jgi:hypothetical protein
MKKTAGLIVKILLGLILLVLIALLTVPVIFKDKIRVTVENTINESVNATVRFEDYSLSFFRNFPNLAFSMKNLSVTGIDKFSGDTLAGFESFNLVFNLASLFKKSGYEVKSVIMDRAVVNAIVHSDGSVNWDIEKDTTTVEDDETEEASDMKILLELVEMRNSRISYIDYESDMSAYLRDVSFSLTGDMTETETDLKIKLRSDDFTFVMEGMKYLNRSVLEGDIDLLANLDTYKYTFRENYLSVNDLKLNFTGWVAMPEDDIETDLEFSTPQTTFKTLLSLVPAIYMKDYQDLTATGNFILNGSARGIYSDADSTLPDISLNMSVENGLISYPDLPEKITNISLISEVFVDGTDMDLTTVQVPKFHMELAGSPFDMAFSLRTPISDPDFSGFMKGRIDLGALTKAVPMDSIDLSGIIDMSVKMAGRMSMLEKGQYDKFQASGNMNIENMLVAMTGYPEVKINNAGFEFTPAYASMPAASLNIGGKSDFLLSGRLENYIPYVLSDGTIKGNLSLRSKLIDATEIMSKMATDTTAIEDTTSLAAIHIPRNIDFTFDAVADQLLYDKINARNVKGNIVVRDGVLSMRNTGMSILSGSITMNADYDTRDTLKPSVKAGLQVTGMRINDAFNTFNTVQMLAPAAKGVAGIINARLDYSSLLGSNMMPVISSISGAGKIQSDEVTLLESASFDKMKEVLKLGDKFTNTFRDISASFKIADGRIFVSPFDVKSGSMKMNISGDQGIDQTMNYIVKTEIPRSDLGTSVNSLITNLSAQAASFGLKFTPSEIIKVNVKITGTFRKPVITPFFGSGAGESTAGSPKETVKETAKQAVSNAVDDGKAKARAEAEEQGAKIVAEAEQRAQQIRDEAGRAAERLRQEAAVQAGKINEAAASKGALAQAAAKKSADAVIKSADTKATQLVQEADQQANKIVEEAKGRSQALIDKI